MERDDNESELVSSPETRAPQSPPILITGPQSARSVETAAPDLEPPRRSTLPLVLFLLTCLSTYYSGKLFFGSDGGLTYAIAVMAILSAHEMGHFLQAVRYGVPASFPYFIPMPVSPLGTMGAVIVQRAGVADRKSLFDIAISGPLAGLVVALPIAWWGIAHSEIGLLRPNQPVFGNPFLVEWMVALVHRPLQPGEDILLNPMLFAGWVGIFITGLNLFPIGQLDGGHILYTLLKQKAHPVAQSLFLFVLIMIVVGSLFLGKEYMGWTVMLFLLWMMGTRHPPTANDDVPLGKFRIILGWLTLLFVLIGFTPTPMYETAPRPQGHPAAVEQAPTGL